MFRGSKKEDPVAFERQGRCGSRHAWLFGLRAARDRRERRAPTAEGEEGDRPRLLLRRFAVVHDLAEYVRSASAHTARLVHAISEGADLVRAQRAGGGEVAHVLARPEDLVRADFPRCLARVAAHEEPVRGEERVVVRSPPGVAEQCGRCDHLSATVAAAFHLTEREIDSHELVESGFVDAHERVGDGVHVVPPCVRDGVSRRGSTSFSFFFVNEPLASFSSDSSAAGFPPQTVSGALEVALLLLRHLLPLATKNPQAADR